MRKIALSVGLFVVLSLIPIQKVAAACRTVFQTPGGGTILCEQQEVPCIGNNVIGGAVQNITGQCCTTAAECPTGTRPQGVSQTYNICDSVPETEREKCRGCMGQTGDSTVGTWTAIGCITTDPNNLLKTILTLGIGIAGGIAFLLILFGGLQIMTSAGNPEKLNAGRELVSSAITGLILIIFSIFLLKFIGVNIIGIPGFGSPQEVRTVGGRR